MIVVLSELSNYEYMNKKKTKIYCPTFPGVFLEARKLVSAQNATK